MALEYVLSEKGKNKLVHQGYTFIKDKSTDSKVIWKCDKSKTFKCRARVHTSNDSIISHSGDHNHAADVAKLEAEKVVNRAKDLAS